MIVNKLIEKARKKAQGVQASLWQSESTNVSYENDKLKSTESSQRTNISVKVIVDGKIGSSYTTDIKDIDGVVDRALETAEFGNKAHFEFPGPKEGTDVKVYDEAVVSTDKGEMVKVGEEMMAIVKEYNPDILTHANSGRHVIKTEFANSSGVEHSNEETGFYLGVHGEWVRGTDILYAGSGFGWRKREIDHVAIAKEAVEWFRMAEKTAPIKSGNMPVIFTPEGIYVLLLALRLGVDGKNVFLGSSPLRGKIGQKIADERLTIVDNPLIDYANLSEKYDEEGIPHQITPIIEKGVVKNFLYDLDTAGKAGTKTTGHGVGCNPTNTVIESGDISFEDMVKNTREGLLVHEVMGLGQGNPISGEFSVNVQLGYKIENGEIVGRVKDVMLAGNTYDAIKNIKAIGNEAKWVWGSLLVPYMQIGELSVIAR